MEDVNQRINDLDLDDDEVPDVADLDAHVRLPELPPGLAASRGKTTEEILADLNKHPLFMTELEDNDDVAALQALAYEGTPLENAANFKEQGNECFREKRFADAKVFYGKGVAILAAEEARRKRESERDDDGDGNGDDGEKEPANGASTANGKATAVAENGNGNVNGNGNANGNANGADAETDPDDPEEVQRQKALLEQLYVNRAACHLELRNYRSCTLDCAGALRLNERNVKALYRSARALLALDKTEEAYDACARGLELDGDNAALRKLAGEVATRHVTATAKRQREADRLERDKRRKLLLRAALKARGIRTRSTERPPDMEDARVALAPDPDDPRSTLSFPTLLLYPAHLKTDFIKAFDERESLEQHFGYVFPLPWDEEGLYDRSAVECFMETAAGGLFKVGKRVSLLKVLSTAGVAVVDELVRVYVLPNKTRAAAWVREFKAKKALEKGGQQPQSQPQPQQQQQKQKQQKEKA